MAATPASPGDGTKLLLAATAALLAGCKADGVAPAPSASSAVVPASAAPAPPPASLPPPFKKLVEAEWRSVMDPKQPAVRPPAAAMFEWRVLMLQESPRPKKNPRWSKVGPGVSGEFEMPAGSRWRCLYNPVELRPREAGDGEFGWWDVMRTARCSSDGWRTYAEAVAVASVTPDGKITRPYPQAELYLRDVVAGKPLEMTILVRSD